MESRIAKELCDPSTYDPDWFIDSNSDDGRECWEYGPPTPKCNCLNQVRDRIRDIDLLGSKRLLRLQVKDFVDWLKAQGAI